MSTLYALQDEIENIMNCEFDESHQYRVLEYLDDLTDQRKDKIDSIAFVIRQKENEMEFLKQEQALLLQKYKTIENKIKSLKNYVKQVMIKNNIQNIKGHTVTMFLKDTNQVVIENEAILPENMVIVEIKKTPNKNAIKDNILRNEPVPGASIKKNISLVIR